MIRSRKAKETFKQLTVTILILSMVFGRCVTAFAFIEQNTDGPRTAMTAAAERETTTPSEAAEPKINSNDAASPSVPGKINKYTVSFNANGGMPTPSDQQITNGGKAIEPIGVSRGADELEGWYTDAGFTHRWDFASDIVTESITLYAKWITLSGQAVLSASQGDGILKSGSSWFGTATASEYKPDRISFIDCSDGPQTVDGTWLSDWSASGDDSVRCYQVSYEDEVTLYIAFNEPESRKVHTQASFAFGSYDDPIVMGDVTGIDGLELLDAGALTSASRMFYGMKSLQEIDLSFLAESKLTNLYGMFYACSSLTNLDVSGFDTSAVKSMSSMFSNCSSLTNLDVSGFDTSAVTYMSSMFSNCSSLTNLDVSGFDTSSVTNMSYMFYNCSSLTNLDVSGFDTSSVMYMSSMFYNCSSLTNLDVSGFDTSSVDNMYSVFKNCSSLTNLDLGGFSISPSTYVSGMFYGCSRLYTVTIGEEFHPSSAVLPGATSSRKQMISQSIDGRWYSVDVPGTSYTPAEMSSAPAGTYQAMPLSTRTVRFESNGGSEVERQYVETGSFVKEPAGVTRGKDALEGWYTDEALTDKWDFKTDTVTTNLVLYANWAAAYTVCFNTGGGTPELMERYIIPDSKIEEPTGVHRNGDLLEGWYTDEGFTNRWDYASDVVTENMTLYAKWTTLSGQAVLSACQGEGILKSGDSWLNIEAVSADKPDRICFIDCSEGTQTVDGIWLSDWSASGDNSVRCYLVSYEDEVTLYIAFNEPESRKVHTQASFAFGRYDYSTVMEDISRIDGLELLDAGALTSASRMFYGMKSLQEIDLNFLAESRLTNLYGMFYGCSSLTSLDVSGFDTSAVINMSYMFNNCSSLTNLDVSDFDTSAVTYMYSMFCNCSSLTNLGVSGFDTSAVKYMYSMFNNCSSLTSLDVSGFDTSAVTDMDSMFKNCSSLTNLDVSGFKTSAVTDMRNMFNNCSGLTSLDVSGFDTSAVTYIYSMFCNCSSLTNLDLSGFSISPSTSVSGMFAGCSRLYTVTIGEEFHPSSAILPESDYYRKKYISQSIDGRWYSVDVPGTSYSSEEMSSAPAGTYQAMPLSTRTVRFDSNGGSEVKIQYVETGSFVKEPAGVTRGKDALEGWYTDEALTDKWDFKTDTVTADLVLYANWVAAYTVRFDTGGGTPELQERYIVPGSKIAEPTGVHRNGDLLEGWYTDEGFTNRWDYTSDIVTESMTLYAKWTTLSGQAVLSACQGEGILKSGDSWIDTASASENKPDRISFIDCSDGTQTVDGIWLSDWSASGDDSVRCYLVSYEDEVTLYIAFNEPESRKVHTQASFAFGRYDYSTVMEDISRIDGQELLDTGALTSASRMFYSMKSLQEIDLSFLAESKLTNLYGMFYGCSSLTNLDVSGFDTSAVTNMNRMFNNCSSLTSLDVSGFDTSAVTDMDSMFSNCSSLTSFDVSGFDTSSVTDMSSMFASCSSLTNIDVSGFDTSLVTDMMYMFENCSSLTSLDVSGFDTSAVTDMDSMFCNCSSLTSLDVSGFDTSAVKTMSYMFYNCKNLTNLDVSGFDTSAVTDMDSMFCNCSSLTSLDVSGFDTSSVTDMGFMFCGCSSLTNLDVSGFDTSAVTDMDAMFSNCSSLTNLDVSGFDTSAVKYMYSMFYNCSSLTNLDVGGFDTSAVTYMYSMFCNCSSLTSLDVSGFDTSAVKSMSYIFSNCSSLTNLDVSGFDTSAVTNMVRMFYNCSSLTSLDVSDFDTSAVTYMYSMFENCRSLTNLDVSGFDTSAVTDMDSMFCNCSSLTNLDVSGFDTSTVTNMRYMFYNCSSLTNLDLSGFSISPSTYVSGMLTGCSRLYTVTIGEEFHPSSTVLPGATSSRKQMISQSIDGRWYSVDVPETSYTPAEMSSAPAGTYQAMPFTRIVVFNSNGGSSVGSVSVNLGNTVARPIDPVKKGYTFKNWYLGENEYDFSVAVMHDITLTAQWELDVYSIEYILNGGEIETSNPADYTIESADFTLNNPTKKGYIFAGWYSDAKFKTKVTSVRKGSTGNRTFYAKWTPVTYTVAFNGNGSTSGTMKSQTRKYDDGAALTSNTFKKTGYTFIGWNTKANGSGKDYADKKKANLRETAGTTTLYAQWKKDTYKISYKLDGGRNSSKNPASYTVTTSTIKLAEPTRTGYTFAGWYSDAKFKTKAASVKKGSTGNKTFYAKWTPVTYTVAFNGNGSTSGTMKSQTRKYDDGAALTKNAFKKTGYTFIGWNTKANGSGKSYADKKKANLRETAGTTTLYAQWKKNTYKITYELNGGRNSSKNPASYTVTTSTIKLAEPTRKGYTFAGWYSDAKFKTKVTSVKKGSTGNMTFYAKWKKK